MSISRPTRAALLALSACLPAACTGDFPEGAPADQALDADGPPPDASDPGPDADPPIVRADADAPGPDASRPRPDAGCAPGAVELCGNGRDDDCDGEFDEVPEGVGEPCREGLGACARTGIVTCGADGRYACSETAGPARIEQCDGVDDDCDGAVDEGFDVGAACALDHPQGCALAGSRACAPDPTAPSICAVAEADPDRDGDVCFDCAPEDPDVGPSAPERCNLRDDDCDGEVDEGLTCPCVATLRGDRPYLVCGGASTRATADTRCAEYGQVPVEIGAAGEHTFVHAALERFAAGPGLGTLHAWVGLVGPAGAPFAWPSGAPLTHSAWLGGGPQPILRSAGEDCAVLTLTGIWEPRDCLLRTATLCEPPCAPGEDRDGDGFSGCDVDCDDSSATVNPTANEVCSDGLDNDCDGRVDERC